MKEFKSIKFYSTLTGLLCFSVIFSSLQAQEYDDMYFNKSDRKKIKTENKSVLTRDSKSASTIDYTEATRSTEIYSAKNVNPEYIARYKATESNEVSEVVRRDNYSSDDYFIEDYNTPDSAIGSHKNQIDYAALNKRDQMSYSNYNRSLSNPYWGRPFRGFSPYMSMGMGYGFNPYFDPFMMGYGYGTGLSLGMSYGFGSGFYPSMSYSMAMSWGTGYNPWSGWGAYPYSPYSMRGFYDPWGWGPSYAYNGFSPYGGFGMGSYYGYGYSRPNYIYGSGGYDNGRLNAYKPRSSNRSATTTRVATRGGESSRISTAESKIRVPSRTVSSASNGRISRDYSKTQNEYYRNSRSTSSSRISSSQASRNSYSRSSYSSSRYNSSSISNNRPSRLSNSSSGYNRSGSSSSYSNNNGSRSSSSFSSPSRSNSSPSFNRSSYSGSSSRSSSGGSSGSSSRSSSGGSRSGGRQ